MNHIKLGHSEIITYDSPIFFFSCEERQKLTLSFLNGRQEDMLENRQ